MALMSHPKFHFCSTQPELILLLKIKEFRLTFWEQRNGGKRKVLYDHNPTRTTWSQKTGCDGISNFLSVLHPWLVCVIQVEWTMCWSLLYLPQHVAKGLAQSRCLISMNGSILQRQIPQSDWQLSKDTVETDKLKRNQSVFLTRVILQLIIAVYKVCLHTSFYLLIKWSYKVNFNNSPILPMSLREIETSPKQHS